MSINGLGLYCSVYSRFFFATILSVNNTAFIVPMEDELGNLTGLFPIVPQNCEVLEYQGRPYLHCGVGSKVFKNIFVDLLHLRRVGTNTISEKNIQR